MATRDVKINLPVGSPDDTVNLVDKIIARNTAMALTSPIKDDFDWVAVAAKQVLIKQLRTDADKADTDSQKQHYKAMKIMGLAPGQNLQVEGTLYVEVTRIRDILLGKNEDNPEELFHTLDWTDGCIAMKNYEMREVWNLVKDGTLVEIRP